MIMFKDDNWSVVERIKKILLDMDGKTLNEDFFGFTEYQGPVKWEKTKEEGQEGRPYNLFVCNRCKEFMFFSRVYGEFPFLFEKMSIDPYEEAENIIRIHHQRCHIEKEEEK